MMMSWFRQNKQRRQLLVVSVFVVLIVLADVFSGGVIRGTVRTAAAFASATGAFISERVTESELFSSKRNLIEENRALKARITELEQLRLRYSVLRAENQALRALIPVAERESAGIAARVTSFERASPYGTILISAGQKDGVSNGDRIIVGESVALGEVTDVQRTTSLVTLYTRSGAQHPVRIGGITTQIEGLGSGNAQATLPRDVSVASGDEVLLVDSGYIVGNVGHINVSPADATQEIMIYTPVNLSEMPFVMVVPAGG